MDSLSVLLDVPKKKKYKIFPGSGVTGFSDSKLIQTAAGVTLNFAPGSTLWIILQGTDAYGSTTENLLSSTDVGTKGWKLMRAGNNSGTLKGTLAFLTSAGFQRLTTPVTPPNGIGILRIGLRWRSSDNNLSYSINGGPFTSIGVLAPGTAQDGTCKVRIGVKNGTDGSIHLTSGAVLAFALWNREATSTEARNYTYTNANRLQLGTEITGDAATVVEWNAKRDWDGTASTTTTLGSSPITFSVTGTPTLRALDEIRIPVTSGMMWDGKMALSGARAGYKIHNTYNRIKVQTDARYIGLEYYSTQYLGNIGYSVFGAWVNGSYQTSVGAQMAEKNIHYDIPLAVGSSKIVELLEGPGQLGTVNSQSEILGTFFQAIRLPLNTNSTLKTSTAPTNRLVTLGDSILTGFYATTPIQAALTPLLRADSATTGFDVTSHSWGSNSLYYMAKDAPTLAASVASIVAELNATGRNVVWLELGTNDYGFNYWNAATFGTAYAAFVDAIHAAAPNAQIYCQTPIQRISPSSETANGSGNTLDDYRSQIQMVALGHLSFCVFVDGKTIMPNPTIYNAGTNATGDYYTDGLHLGDVGQVDYKTFIEATINNRFLADFSRQNAGGGSSTILGLSIARASANATVQNSATSLDAGGSGTGLASDTARVFYDGTKKGLLVEESRIQHVVHARDLTSGVGTGGRTTGSATHTNNQAGVDGKNLATRVVTTAANWSNYDSWVNSSQDNMIYHFWVKQGSVGATYQGDDSTSAGNNRAAIGGSAPAVWTRLVFPTISNASAGIAGIPARGIDMSAYGGVTAGARDQVVDFVTIESGGSTFATSEIYSAGNTSQNATRAADLPSAPSSALTSGGKLAVEFDIYPLGASSAYKNDQYLWYYDASNNAYIQQSTRKIIVTLAGNAFTLPVAIPSFSANDDVKIYLECGTGIQSHAWVSINGTVTDLGYSLSSQGAAPSGTIYLLNNSTAGVLSCVLRKLITYV